MDVADIDWLRTSRSRIRVVVTEERFAAFETDDYNVYDALDDYLTEVLESRLGEWWFRRVPKEPPETDTYLIIFQDRAVSPRQLRDVLAKM